MMIHNKTYALLALIVIVIGLFLYVMLEPKEKEPTIFQDTLITMVHTYNGGTHTYDGSIFPFSPCDEVVVTPRPSSNSKIVTLEFTHTSFEGDCSLARPSKSFEVSFEAPKDITVEGIFNGVPVELFVDESKMQD